MPLKLLPFLSSAQLKIIHLIWGGLVFLQLFQDWVTSRFLETSFQWRESLVFSLKWLLYIPATFILIYFYNRFPLQEKVKFYRHLVSLIVITSLLTVVHLVLFGLLLNLLWPWAFHLEMNLPSVYHKLFSTYWLNVWIIYVLILIIYRAYQIYEGLKNTKIENERLEKELVRSKLAALKMQLQPHFLFNTHHNIISLMQKGDNSKATDMLIKLSDLLRLSLKENKTDLVTLGNEIEWLKKYLDIIALRFGARFKYTFDLHPEVDAVLIPPMLLQPVLENAIKYGLEPVARPVHVYIRIHPENELKQKLVLEVEDDGMDQASIQTFNFGVGLSNVQDRLHTLFGDDSSLTIKSNEPSPGITVSIFIPWITQPKL